jgi:hypothetical protein
MKRYEMFDLIVEIIESHTPNNIMFENQVYYMADDILNKIEKAGMLPPETVFTSQGIQYWENKWEPEE